MPETVSYGTAVPESFCYAQPVNSKTRCEGHDTFAVLRHSSQSLDGMAMIQEFVVVQFQRYLQSHRNPTRPLLLRSKQGIAPPALSRSLANSPVKVLSRVVHWLQQQR